MEAAPESLVIGQAKNGPKTHVVNFSDNAVPRVRRCWAHLRGITDVLMTEPSVLIAASLAESDRDGYAIMEDVARFAGVSLGTGTLYGAITRLEDSGWIRPVKAKDRRQPHALTAAGRGRLTEQLHTLSRIASAVRARLEQAYRPSTYRDGPQHIPAFLAQPVRGRIGSDT